MRQADASEEPPPTPCRSALEGARRLLDGGAVSEAEAVVRLALSHADGAMDALWARALLAEVRYQAGQIVDAQRLASAVSADAEEARAEDSLATRPWLEAQQTLAKVALAQGRLAQARVRYAAYVEAAERSDDELHLALALGGAGVAALQAGDGRVARDSLRRAQDLARRIDEAKPIALAASNLAVLDHLEHHWAQAAVGYAIALDALGRVGNRASLARAAFNLGELHESLGDITAAGRLCRLGEAVAGVGAPPAARAQGLLLRGRIALSLNSHASAAAAFEAALDLLEDVDRVRAPAAQIGCALARVGLGEPTAALRLLEALPLDLSATRKAEAALAQAACIRALGQDARAATEQALMLAREAHDPCLEMRAAAAAARALADGNQRREAATLAASALQRDRACEGDIPEASLEAFRCRPVRRRLEQLAAGRARSATPHPGRALIGRSDAMEDLRRLIDKLAPSSCAVTIEGESGTGKELVASLLVAGSERAERPFVRVDCASIAPDLVESALFGHERGAFTDAVLQQIGCFERADGGTLLLDSVDEASPRLQAALLRALSEGQVRRVGGETSMPVDVRVLSTSVRPLSALTKRGGFREDLRYRLEGARLNIPPLRERALDLPLLAEHLLRRDASARGVTPTLIGEEALHALGKRGWPGNVRELDNALRAASVFADDGHIGLETLSAMRLEPAGERADLDERDLCYRWLREEGLPLRRLKKEIERACVMRALDESDGTISRAAALLGMKRPRLSQLVNQYRREAEEEGP